MPALRQLAPTGTNHWSRDPGPRHYVCRRCGITKPRRQSKTRPETLVCADCKTVDPLYRKVDA
jgi:hypothetical protein